MTSRAHWWLVLPSLALAPASCQPDSSAAGISGSFGVFYGGQVQRLKEVVWDGNEATPLGFRVEIPESESTRGHRLRWELVRPGPEGRRVTLSREEEIEPHRQRVDQVIEIPQGAPLGTINVRVLVDGQLVIDRAILLRRK